MLVKHRQIMHSIQNGIIYIEFVKDHLDIDRFLLTIFFHQKLCWQFKMTRGAMFFAVMDLRWHSA